MAFETLVHNIQKLKDVNPTLCETFRQQTYDIVGCCMDVHRDMGPFLNEYMYQEALSIILKEKNIPYIKEHYFSVDFHGQTIKHKHYVDFFVRDNVYVECKAIASLGPDQRQQLWNYMRLSGVEYGILYNFAPVKDQCERYYLDKEQQVIYMF